MSADPPRTTCDKCAGAGKLIYRIAGSEEKINLGNGTYIQDAGGSGTRACPCVASLPAIDGAATWWESEHVYSAVVDVPIGCECIEVAANCEIPRDDNGRRVHRTADNAYYPPLVEILSPENVTLLAEDARKLAEALIAAAAACDKADELAMATRDGGYGVRGAA